MRNQFVKSACVLAAIVAAPGIAQAQNARAANAEILDTAKEAAAARQRNNCVRLSVMRNRLNDIRADANHPFWARHGLDEDRAARARVMENITRSVTQLFSLDCKQPTPPPKFVLDGGFRYMDRFVGGKLGVGTVVTAGDPFFLSTPSRVDGWSGHLNYLFTYDMWRHHIGVSYSETKAKGTAVEPVGGNAIGYVPGDATLGAGVNFGAFGASATSAIKQKDFTLDYKIMRDFNLDRGFNWGLLPSENSEKSEKQIGVATTFRLRKFDHAGHLQRTPDPTNVYVDIDQSLDSTELLIGPAISGRHMYEWTGMYIGGFASLQAGILRSKLDSTERMCFGCGGATTTSAINESKTDFNWRAVGVGTIGYKLKGGLDFNTDASLSYGTRHIIDTRQNPADTSTTIGKATGLDWGIGVRVRYTY